MATSTEQTAAGTLPATAPVAFTGWYRPHSRAPWQRVAEAPTAHEAWQVASGRANRRRVICGSMINAAYGGTNGMAARHKRRRLERCVRFTGLNGTKGVM
jgi:hypothetical protein